ncbi:MAG: Swt1 family HEPN domain-containing protein [Rhodospirillaceae bacterium]
MIDDPFSELERARRALLIAHSPLNEMMERINADTSLQVMFENIEAERRRAMEITAPFQERLHDALTAVTLGLPKDLLSAIDHISEFQNTYTLPDINETISAITDSGPGSLVAALANHNFPTLDYTEALIGLSSPWMALDDPLTSITGLRDLQELGQALRAIPAFDDHLTDALRLDLGDWSHEVNWPQNIFQDPLARHDFYVAQGMNPSLTAFPSDAFNQSLRIAGLGNPLLHDLGQIEGLRSEEVELEDPDELEPGFRRTNGAHDQLMRFETYMRQFIEEQMSAVYGAAWIKTQVPGDLRKKWQKKRQAAMDMGATEKPLITYADFTDYVKIITRKDNWNALFKHFFKNPESVHESFRRLYPIRICTMHARIITQDDVLYLRVEVKRMLSAMGIEV